MATTDNVAEGLESAIGEGGHLYGFVNDGRALLVVPELDTAIKARDVLGAYQVVTWVGQPDKIDWQAVADDSNGLSEEPTFRVDLWANNAVDSKLVMARIGERLLKTGAVKRVRNIASPDMPPGWGLKDALAAQWDTTRIMEWVRRENGKYLVPAVIPKDKPKPKRIAQADERESTHILWRSMGLDVNGPGGMPPANEDTVDRILSHHKVPIWYDDFLQRPMTQWNRDEPGRLQDSDVAQLCIWIQRTLRLHKMTLPKVKSGVEAYLYYNRRNVAREWLDSLHWDGVPRLRDLLPRGFGTRSTEYHQSVGRNFVMGIAHRVLEPGCQWDYMPIFEGPQGIRKSTALRVLGGEWYTELHEDITSKDFLQNLAGNMLVDLSELSAVRRGDADKIKGIISNREDTYRASYGRLSGRYPRMCAFVGTTNRNDWHADDTGGRRFWRVICGDINTDWIAENREQLFAEAVALLLLGEEHWRIPEAEAAALIKDATVGDPWTDAVQTWIEAREQVRPEDVLSLALSVPLERQERAHLSRVTSILRRFDWVPTTMRVDGQVKRVWRPSRLPATPGGTGDASF